MKIVIDLPEEVTEWFKERAFIPIMYYTEVEKAMEKAEPLSKILDKISAEIEEAYNRAVENDDKDYSGLAEARLIVETYKGVSK